MSEPETIKTDEEIVELGNKLARKLYLRLGYMVSEDYKMCVATHPDEEMCWEMACIAFEMLDGTDLREAWAVVADGEMEDE